MTLSPRTRKPLELELHEWDQAFRPSNTLPMLLISDLNILDLSRPKKAICYLRAALGLGLEKPIVLPIGRMGAVQRTGWLMRWQSSRRTGRRTSRFGGMAVLSAAQPFRERLYPTLDILVTNADNGDD